MACANNACGAIVAAQISKPKSRRLMEVLPLYAITSSALTVKVCGIVRPNALAVLRLRTSLNFVGCSTGRSAGFHLCSNARC